MHAAGRKSSNSSDDDLLDETEELGTQRKKHFLDYDYGDDSIGESHEKINVGSHMSASTSSNGMKASCSSSSQNMYTSNQLELKKKIIDRTTKMEQLSSSTKSAQTNGNKINNNNIKSVYSILSILNSTNSSSDEHIHEITSKLLEFSKNREMCVTLRQSGCISQLVQIIHSDPNDEIRQKQCLQTLHNIIHCNADDKAGRREARVMKLIEQLFDYCDALRLILKNKLNDEIDRHPIQAIGTLMKISFDGEHRHAMCLLGALQTISTLIQLDHAAHSSSASTNSNCITMRRYAGMCLTNLTFGDGNNKALLCSNKNFMKALVDQINSNSDELVQVTASVIRNLSWRADPNMKQALNEIDTIKILMSAAMKCMQENTLKAILSALWNLSNHCAKNKAEICDIDGAIEFLIDMLSYDAPSKTMAVIENAGGILRNISTHMAMYEKYRVILRQKGCFTILLQQLKSPSLTVVSNACGTLGNLSAHSVEDQKFLRENGSIPMLRSLIYSKHKMISTGSTIALRHLLACKSNIGHGENLDSVAKMMDLKELPTLNVRKQRALEQELSLNTESYKNDETSPSSKDDKTKDFEVDPKVKVMRNNNEIKVQNIEDDDEEEEAPTNFSKFDNDQEASDEKCEYQVDQITDYSIRYGREEEDDDEEEIQKRQNIINADDTTKCYNTEDTPHIISKAGSMSDLRKVKEVKTVEEKKLVKGKFSANASGIQTPDKVTNYCVEGTPGNFSRNDSLSDLEEASTTPPLEIKMDRAGPSKSSISKIPPAPLSIHKKEPSGEKEFVAATPKSVTFGNLAEETPLMFSRTSSMGSLSSAEPACDDKSSVVSDFSRMASGIMSPSELPDSPTQSISQSPSSRHNHMKQASRNVPIIKAPMHAIRGVTIGAEAAEDCTNTFNVENTPAVFSSRTSLSNLSFDDEPKISTDAISKDFQLMKHPSEEHDDQKAKIIQDVTADQSDAESSDDNILLESCINMGINRVVNKDAKQKVNESTTSATETNDASTSIQDTIKKCHPQMLKENPMDMLRSVPMLPPYLPVDEINRFIVEDSPCNFSLMSGLSAITIESNANQSQHQPNANKPTAKVEPTIRAEENAVGTSSKKSLPPAIAEFDDSLSSLSLESEDDTNLLNQAIAAGYQKPKKQETSNPINIPINPRTTTVDVANDSISSVDSCDKDEATNSILEQCIRSGINKVVKKDSAKNRPLMTSSPKKSMLPQPKSSKSPQKKAIDQSLKDEELLKECIVTGMMKTSGLKQNDPLVENFSQISITDSKNVETSVIATGAHCAITDVGEKNTEKNKLMTYSNGQDESIASEKEHSHQAIWTMQNGSSNSNYEWSQSIGSMDDNILERSNEYPANKLSMLACGEIDDESIMDVSNEFMIENEKIIENKIEDKHKNPDLMLKSVDRLTQELVSTAEYLRKNALDEVSEQKMSNSISNNTWNDEISFPSISMTAPMIGSTNDEATFATDQICPLPEEKSEKFDNNQINDITPTNEQYKFEMIEKDDQYKEQKQNKDVHDSPSPIIDFKVGGEIASQPSVSKINFLSCGPASIDTLSSTMSNSTIVQTEARRIANKLANNILMDSTTSLDLENVRPPSSMDSISLCSFQELSVQQSPHKNQPKKSLMTGLVAKRALGHQMFGGSVDSVNSINNIDSIRPPSIMDELLDSMISVDSIVSEIVDPTLGISNYETALSDMEDSLTLRSCQDLSKDETLTPISSDFSSVESTPKKKRSMRASPPKQKRQSEKDRYKTYTIAVDMVLQQQQQECSSTESGRRLLNARQRRQEDRQRFETSSPSQSAIRRKDDPDRFKTYCIDNDDDFSIRAMTANFEFIRTEAINVASNVGVFDQSDIRNKLNQIKTASNGLRQSDESIDYEHQTSETESQRDLKNSTENNIVAPEENKTNEEEIEVHEQPKLKQATKSSYISPYRMTTKITPTKSKSVRVTKTPVIAKVVTPKQPTQTAVAKSNLANGKVNGAKSHLGVIPKATPTHTQVKNTPAKTTVEPESTLIRQGTFVKDEPTNQNVPVVDNEINLPTPKPPQQLSKIKPPSRIATIPKKSPDSKNSSPKRTSSIPSSITQLKYRSNSTASMKVKEISTPVARSNTGINLNPRKNVTSKIAGIWKNNNEKKEVMLRKPISVSSTQLNGSKLSTPTGSANKKLVNSPTKETRIKRSSTCDEIV